MTVPAARPARTSGLAVRVKPKMYASPTASAIEATSPQPSAVAMNMPVI
jgi:hypothetical protein